MAEEPIVNGVSSDQTEVKSKVWFEDEKARLIRENEENEEKIKLLMDEIDALKTDRAEMKKRLNEQLQKEIGQSEQDKKALEAISSHAADLETEVSRLQHELADSEDAIKELSEVKSAFEGLKQSDKEKAEQIEKLVKEKAELVEKLAAEKAANESRIQELEKIVAEYVSKVSKKESEIVVLKKENDGKDTQAIAIRDELKKSEANAEAMEAELGELRTKVEEYKQNNLMNVVVRDESGKESAETGENGFRFQWPTALASTGTFAAAVAAFYIGYARRR
ncbi:hypothetical protein ACHQM5_018130 [Ranunculus cassubicifolius]